VCRTFARNGPRASVPKTPEYTADYVETWKHRSQHQRVKHAWIGLGIAVAGRKWCVTGLW
jgi:hypothetical protein